MALAADTTQIDRMAQSASHSTVRMSTSTWKEGQIIPVFPIRKCDQCLDSPTVT